MSHKLDSIFFEKLRKSEPSKVCNCSLATYNNNDKFYRITAFNEEYFVFPEQNKILKSDNPDYKISVELSLLILVYLLESKEISLSNNWVSETSIKGGAMFFQGPHSIKNKELADHFGNSIEDFKKNCIAIGGKEESIGDAAYKFQILPKIPVIVAFWYADEEFPASAKLLVDKSIKEHLPLDVIFGMALELYSRIIGKQIII